MNRLEEEVDRLIIIETEDDDGEKSVVKQDSNHAFAHMNRYIFQILNLKIIFDTPCIWYKNTSLFGVNMI